MKSKVSAFILLFIVSLFVPSCGDSEGSQDGKDASDSQDKEDAGKEASGKYCDEHTKCPEGEECDFISKIAGLCVFEGSAMNPEPWEDTPDAAEEDDDAADDDDDDNDDNNDDIEEGCKDLITKCLDDERLITCKPDGSGPQEVDCTAFNQVCHIDRCATCKPNTAKCKDALTHLGCTPDGEDWKETECGEKMRCDPDLAKCVPSVCTPTKGRCIDDITAELCNEDGSEKSQIICEGGEYCHEASDGTALCADLCALAVSSASYFGCEYWAAVLSNSQLPAQFQDLYAVVIGNTHPRITANVQIFSKGDILVTEVEVYPNSTKPVYLPWIAPTVVDWDVKKPFSTISDSAYKIVSDIPITVYQFNPLDSSKKNAEDKLEYTHTNDASLLLPAHVNSKVYVGMSYPHTSTIEQDAEVYLRPGYIAIVATAPGVTETQVYFRGYTAAGVPGSEIEAYEPGDTALFTLKQYEMLTLTTRKEGAEECESQLCYGNACKQCISPEADLTGSIITADQPIAVFGGADCAYIPYNKGACDHIEEQLFPFDRWGNKYFATRAKPTGKGTGLDLWRVLAGVGGTKVTISPKPEGLSIPAELGAGEIIEFFSDGNFLIESQGPEHPILVSQFLYGQNAGQGMVGDPAMILAAPVAQYRSDYLFLTPNTYFQDFANVIRPAGVEVLLNGKIIPRSSFKSIGSSGYEVAAAVELPDGQSMMESSQPFGLVVYGYDAFVSYGYLGGLDLRHITTVNPGQ